MLKQMYKQSVKKQLRWDTWGSLDAAWYNGFTSHKILGTTVWFSVSSSVKWRFFSSGEL